MEFLEWWETEKVEGGSGGDMWFQAQLRARFAQQKGRELIAYASGEGLLEKRLGKQAENQVLEATRVYRDDLFLLRLWLHDQRRSHEEKREVTPRLLSPPVSPSAALMPLPIPIPSCSVF